MATRGTFGRGLRGGKYFSRVCCLFRPGSQALPGSGPGAFQHPSCDGCSGPGSPPARHRRAGACRHCLASVGVPALPPGCWSLQAWPGSATPPALGVSGVVSVWHATLACSGCPLALGCFWVALPLTARFVRVPPGCRSLQAWPGSATPAGARGFGAFSVRHALRACSGWPWPRAVPEWQATRRPPRARYLIWLRGGQ